MDESMGPNAGDSVRQLTLFAVIAHVPDTASLQMGYELRPIREADREELAQLYFESYNRDIVADKAAAREEFDLTFAGEYGRLDLSASPVVTHGSDLVAAVLTVEEAPWPDTPPEPFIIEVMVHPAHRRCGLAEHGLVSSIHSLSKRGKENVGLRVMSDNVAAMKLYRKLGFEELNGF